MTDTSTSFDSLIDDLLAREEILEQQQESVSGSDPDLEAAILNERLLIMIACLQTEKIAYTAAMSDQK